ncbi:hypothetical protein N9D31_03870 [Oligoflexaceae bacterium]|nr:hypothetical protein [Oligoflexaceae bacterium]
MNRTKVPQHRDTVYSFQNLLSRAGEVLDREDNTVLRSLVMLARDARSRKFNAYEKLAELICRDNFFPEAKRISYVRRLGLSNQLRTEASWNADGYGNSMEQGYTCFTDPEGSLFSLGRYQIRTFDSAESVVGNFAADNQRPQRSIHRISRMGMVSGICMPIFAPSSRVLGFFFINSDRYSYFRHLNEGQKTLLYYATTLFESVVDFDACLTSSYYDEAAKRESFFDSQRFERQKFIDLAQKEGLVVTAAESEPFLLSFGNIFYLLKKTAREGGGIDLRFDSCGTKLHFTFESENQINNKSILESHALGWRLTEEGNLTRLTQDIDWADPEELYSVEERKPAAKESRGEQ